MGDSLELFQAGYIFSYAVGVRLFGLRDIFAKLERQIQHRFLSFYEIMLKLLHAVNNIDLFPFPAMKIFFDRNLESNKRSSLESFECRGLLFDSELRRYDSLEIEMCLCG